LLDDAFAGNDAPHRGNDLCAPRENGFIDIHSFHCPKASEIRAPCPARVGERQFINGLILRKKSQFREACARALPLRFVGPISASIPHADRAAILKRPLAVASSPLKLTGEG
jgi:hypothetical protein